MNQLERKETGLPAQGSNYDPSNGFMILVTGGTGFTGNHGPMKKPSLPRLKVCFDFG